MLVFISQRLPEPLGEKEQHVLPAPSTPQPLGHEGVQWTPGQS